MSFPARKRLFRLTQPTSKDASEDFAELLIDSEEDRTLRAVLVGMLLGGRARRANDWREIRGVGEAVAPRETVA